MYFPAILQLEVQVVIFVVVFDHNLEIHIHQDAHLCTNSESTDLY